MTKRKRESLLKKVTKATAAWRKEIAAQARKAKVKVKGVRYTARANAIAKAIEDGDFYDDHKPAVYALAALLSGETLPSPADPEKGLLPKPQEWTAVVPLKDYDSHDYDLDEPIIVFDTDSESMEGVKDDGEEGNYLTRKLGYSRPATAREIKRLTDEQLEAADNLN